MSTLQSNPQTTTAAPAQAAAKPRYKGKSGAQILHEMLVGPHKVDTMFGYPGGAILPMFDQLYKTPAKFILNRHEQASGHCADGYARATGKPGVCIVTSGPGATNTVTPLATAQLDSIPILVFSGQVATKVIGNDAFQEADVTGITRPCTKWNYLIKDVRELPRIINEAFLIATSGRPGPVLVDLPKDVTTGICPEEVDDTPRPHVVKRKNSALGAQFDDRVTGNLATFAPKAKIIHIDIDPSSISKNVDVDVPVVGDARISLEAMLPCIEYRERKEWLAQIEAWKKRYPFKYLDDSKNTKPQQVIEQIN